MNAEYPALTGAETACCDCTAVARLNPVVAMLACDLDGPDIPGRPVDSHRIFGTCRRHSDRHAIRRGVLSLRPISAFCNSRRTMFLFLLALLILAAFQWSCRGVSVSTGSPEPRFLNLEIVTPLQRLSATIGIYGAVNSVIQTLQLPPPESGNGSHVREYALQPVTGRFSFHNTVRRQRAIRRCPFFV